ncbi:MAG TPA: DUF4838 domain-containing protein, partial [Armatimonadetes bacterium]|nr:DUF4838 domain-containing protein [Armatimonadota bacterium]
MRILMLTTVLILGGINMAADVQLVLNGVPKATIVAPRNGPPAYAASEIQRYVQEMSGAKLPIVTSGESASTAPNPPRIIIRIAPGVVKHDGYRIYVQDGDVIIEASEPRGCIYGAYGLLEHLGCRFYGPAPPGIIVPKRITLRVPETFNIHREPAFANRLPSSGTPEQQMQWGFNFTGVAGTPARKQLIEKLGMRQYRWGHIWPALIEKQFFADGRNPEKMDYTGREDWLPADENGVRRYNGQSLCFSNQQAFEWFTDNAVNWVLTYCRDADYVSLWSADTWRIALCRCEKCKARGLNATDWYLLTHNEIRRKLNERGWHNIFGWIAYHGSEEPPSKINLLDNGRNMDFLYAPRPRGGTQYGPFTSDHPVSIKYRRNLQAWREYLSAQKYQGTRTVFEYYYDLV